MTNRIDIQWLKENNACSSYIAWFEKQDNKEYSVIDLLNLLFKEKLYLWANWLIVRNMNSKQRVKYAIFAAEQVLHIYENRYPEDKRPRLAIEVAKRCLKDPSEENKDMARAAVFSVANAIYAAYKRVAQITSYGALEYAEYAVFRASCAAKQALCALVRVIDADVWITSENMDSHIALYSTRAASYASEAAYYDLVANSVDDNFEIYLKILHNGIELLKEGEEKQNEKN